MQLFCPAPLLGDTQGSPLSAPFTPGERLEESLSSNTVFLHGCNWERAVRSHPSSHSNASYGVLCPQHISSGWKQLYLYVSASFVPPSPSSPPSPIQKQRQKPREITAHRCCFGASRCYGQKTQQGKERPSCVPRPPHPPVHGTEPCTQRSRAVCLVTVLLQLFLAGDAWGISLQDVRSEPLSGNPMFSNCKQPHSVAASTERPRLIQQGCQV